MAVVCADRCGWGFFETILLLQPTRRSVSLEIIYNDYFLFILRVSHWNKYNYNKWWDASNKYYIIMGRTCLLNWNNNRCSYIFGRVNLVSFLRIRHIFYVTATWALLLKVKGGPVIVIYYFLFWTNLFQWKFSLISWVYWKLTDEYRTLKVSYFNNFSNI